MSIMNEFNELADRNKWSDVERQHALANIGNEYGDECILELANGRAIHTPAYPESCSYVRIVQSGFELSYWTSEEWAEDAEGVMGAILGCAHGDI